jgi:hypothetical protein
VRRTLILAALLCLAVGLPAPAGAWVFSHLGVDSTGAEPGQFNSLAIAKNGRLHASYFLYDGNSEGNQNLVYATKPSSRAGTWTRRLVDGTSQTGSYSSISLEKNGNPHIAYYESEFSNLKHAWYDSALGNWRTEVVDAIGTVGQYSSIAVDTLSGAVNILYFDATKPGLKWARKPVGGLWSFAYVDTVGVCGLFASAIFISGQLEVAYYDLLTGNLRYARQDGPAWVITPIDTPGDVGRYCSLAGSRLRRIIAYYDATNDRLKVAQSAPGGPWSVTPLDAADDPGQGISAAIGPSGRPGIVYYAMNVGDLRYAEEFHGTWLFDTIATGGDVGRFCSLRYDEFDLPVVLYFSDTLNRLRSAFGRGEVTGVPDPAPPTSTPGPALTVRTKENPVRGAGRLELTLPADGAVELSLFDVAGRRLRRLELAGTAGTLSHDWDSRDDAGRPLPSGVYFLRVRQGNASVTTRLTFLR